MKNSFCPQFIADVLAQCKANSARIAVVDGDGRKSTYADLLNVIRRTSGFIRSKGIAPKSFIVVNLPNGMEYLAVEFGAWLSGCSVAPVSPLYPQARIDFIADHCESPLVVDEAVLEQIMQAPELDVCEPDADIAALFYTSGSTGTPKGVIHTFETLSHIDRFPLDVIKVREDDCFATGAPLSFIAWIFTLPFLRKGACVRFLDRQTATDVRLLQDAYRNGGITCGFISPSALRQVDLSPCDKLRFIITGSERVSGVKPQGNYRLFNVYGMTETAGGACYFTIDKEYENTPLGSPTRDVEMKIADDGEICFRGVLTPGYYKDPERSAALWSGGWLHTGDLGRILPDGNFEYVNRKDWMVKINGQRVETGEISAVMKQVPGVSNAVAKGFTSADGHQYIVAYYIAEDSVTLEALKEYMASKLAPYMMPAHYVRMAALPQNLNGKIDVKSLQSPVELAAQGRTVTPAETELQKTLCAAFEAALGISPIGIDDDFFLMGGDSIRVMQLQTLCRDMDITTDMVYRTRTVRALAKALEANDADLAPEAQQNEGLQGSECPLSQTQTGIYVESMNRAGEIAYNNPFLYRIPDGVDPDKLAAACSAALAAHPQVFASITDSPAQKRPSADECSFTPSVRRMSDAEFASLRHTLVRPFNLLEDRLFRMEIFKTESAVWLFYDFHHIIFDGTSNSVLMADIEDAYSGQSVEAETFTGFDVAVAEEHQRSTSFLEECRKWNLEHFLDADGTTLPAPDLFGDTVTFGTLDEPADIAIDAFAKAAARLGVTENVLATAAFGYMLGSCSHARESAFTTIYNGRKSLRTGRTVSMMVKTLPVLCKWDASTPIGQYMQEMKAQLAGSMAHDLYSFAELCSETAYDSRVLFTFQDELLERERFCGVACEMLSLLDNATGEPMAVQLYKKGGVLRLRTEFRSNMYSEGYIRKYVDCFRAVLSSLLMAEKDALTSSLSLVGKAEAGELIKLGWGPKMDFDSSETFVSMFRKAASARPEAIAVVDENGSMTYSELDSKSDAIASLLAKEGVEPEDFVALMLPRLRCFPASFVACFKCGAAYVPMDCEYPADRLQYMLEDSGAKVLITTRELFGSRFADGGIDGTKVVFVDEMPQEAPAPAPMNLARPDGLAYMIYTSGTTGRPKGVMIEHRCLANLVNWAAEYFKIGPGARVAQHASFSFDGSIVDLMTPLCFGGELHILPASIRKDLGAMYRYFSENRIDGLTYTTQLGLAMLRMFDLKLKYMFMGGEKMAGVPKTSVRVVNGYGPTEFTVCSSLFEVDSSNVPDNIPIGRAVPNTLSAVVDPLGRLLPMGVEGELVLVGVQLARGYWHREDVTAERFVPCPFIPGEKMYRTGDLVRWSPEGELLYLGRIDSQVKLRGFRIELGEIESNILRYPGIKMAVVAVREIAGLQHLCAYYTSSEPVDSEDLRSFLAKSLTDYMVPTAFMNLDAMPMTPNGKVDMRSLPLPEIKAEETVAPEGETESTLFAIASEFLKTDAFGVTSNLISMGLTSLGAINLSLLFEKKAGIKLSSAKMLENPTIRQWASLAGESEEGTDAAAESFAPQDDYPLTDNQVGIYIDWEQNKDSIQYNVPMLLGFTGIEASRVADAVRRFIAAHPCLKVGFKSVDGQTRQYPRADMTIEVPVAALSTLPDKSFFQSRLRPFDLFEGPLCRFELFSFEDKVWLLSDIHHIIFDGGSESIFVSDIVAALKGEDLRPEKMSALDYSLYYDNWKKSAAYEKAEKYFESLLEGAVSVTLPTTEAAQGSGAASIGVDVPREAVRKCCRSFGVTENSFFLAAMTEVLHRFTRENNLTILTVSSGRSLSALERTSGMFVQTLPVASHHAQRSVEESLKSMYHQVVETVSRDKFPFTKIVEKCGIKANILMAYQGDVLGTDLSVEGKAVEMTGLALETAKMPLSVNVTPEGSVTHLVFEYDRAVYNECDVRLFARAVAAYASNMATAGKDAMTSDIPCLGEEESAAVVELGRGPQMQVEADKTVVSLMHRFAASNPDAPAVVDCCSSITYAELDRCSDVLASALLKLGLKKESFVGLMLPRRKEFPISVFAVFKSGCAYVPMDSEYPLDRLQYMLEDSNAQVLVTTHEIFDSKVSDGGIKVKHVIFIEDVDFSVPSAYVDRSEPQGLAYMIYTSGTTGKPKGVMIEHHSLVNTISWHSSSCGVGPGTRVGHHPSFSFDASIMDLMPTLSVGGTVHIFDEAMRKDPEKIYKYLNDNAIEGLVMSTQLGMMLLSSYKLNLRYLVLGGEKLAGKFDNRLHLVNGYGPTEFTVCSSYYDVDMSDIPENIPIGRPVPNTVSAIVDGSGMLLPRGVAGELVLVGPQLARGYWNKPDITAKRFVPCPFIPGEKMYRTGDLARWNEDGDLLFMGRIDSQVKLRGFRIELGEIESVLSSFEGVSAAVAQVREISGVQHLVAYYTSASPLDEAKIRGHLSSRLTSYMVPDALVRLDAMPFTPNGKVDLKALPVPELSGTGPDIFEAPEGERETKIAEAFAHVLGSTTPISRNASFFLMGGTSLLVMKVIVMLSDGGMNVTYGDVFKYPTPRALAAFLDGVEAGMGSASAAPAPSQDVSPASAVSEQTPVVGADGYDYSAVNKALENNTISSIGDLRALNDHPIGDVLLLGSTGFLGIHILNHLLTSTQGRVYCVIRPKKGVSCAGRLKSYLMYYFDKTFADLFDTRLFIVEGDMTDDGVMAQLLKIKVDTVINCAANVKHFAAGDEIEKINLHGAEQLIEYCLKTGSRLVHTSTHSISGQMENAAPHIMTENELYFGQVLMTKYQTSKFAAERAILQAVADKGLRAKIVRLGNLMPRFSDGEFQINVENNGFMARMRAYYLIGCIASSHLHGSLEFAPIDATASAIETLACTPDRFTVFHPFNNHTIYLDDVVAIMRRCGLPVEIVDDATFSSRLNEALKDDRINPFITTLLAYGSHNDYVVNSPSLDFTVNVLNAMDWRWPITGERYLSATFEKLITLEYFNK